MWLSSRVRWVAPGILLSGIALVGAAVLWGWGRFGYGVGVAVLLVGIARTTMVLVERRRTALVLAAGGMVVALAAAILVVTGPPRFDARWDDSEVDGIGGRAARVGELYIIGGAAHDITTGRVVWQVDDAGQDNPLLVTEDLVVIGTENGAVGVDPSSGATRWRSTVTGRGIAHHDGVLVLSVDSGTAIGIDLATGESRWVRDGRPVMECELGRPTDRYVPALDQTAVLLGPGEWEDGGFSLLDVADGTTTVEDVHCAIKARVAGDVLVQADGDDFVGMSAQDGTPRWRTSWRLWDLWDLQGGATTLFVPQPRGAAVIDVATGTTEHLDAPERDIHWPHQPQLTDRIWILLDGTPPSLWSPATGKTVPVPGADSLTVEDVHIDSGWLSLAGTTTDLTGTSSPQCWALSPDGRLYGPVPGPGCQVGEGLIGSDQGIFPVGELG